MNYDDYTIVIVNGYYPIVEVCLNSIYKFYPGIKMIVVFTIENQVNDLRLKLLKEQYNIEILTYFGKGNHGNPHGIGLNLAINNVDTKYFITLDDDTVVLKDFIGVFDNIFNSNSETCSIGQLSGFYQSDTWKNVSQRFYPHLFVSKTEIFKKYNLSFEDVQMVDRQLYFDIGGTYLIDHLRYNLKYQTINIGEFIVHFRSLTMFLLQNKEGTLHLLEKDVKKLTLDDFGIIPSETFSRKEAHIKLFCKEFSKMSNHNFKKL